MEKGSLVHPAAFRPKHQNGPLVVGSGSDMQIRPDLWEKWNSDACDKDMWKHGRISDPYRDNYDKIKWERKGS